MKVLGDRILIKKIKEETVTTIKGGIIISTKQVQESQKWEVLQVGSLVTEVLEGSKIVTTPTTKIDVVINGEEYGIIKEKDIVLIL